MTVTTRQVTELADGRCGVRDRYACSFPRRHDSAGLVRSRTCRQCRYSAPRRADTRRTTICRLCRAPCWRIALRHSDVLAMAGWMGPTRSTTVGCPPGQRFPSREASSFGEPFTAFVFGHARLHSSIGCADRLRTLPPRLNASCRPAPGVAQLDAWRNEAGPPLVDELFVTVTLLPCVPPRERRRPASVYIRLMDKIDYP